MTRTAGLMTAAAILAAGTAQADVCSSLQQQYIAAGGGGYSSAPRGADVAALNRSLQAAQAAAAANRCNAGLFAGIFGGGPSPSCEAINQQIYSLQEQIRQAYAGGGVGAGRVGTIVTFAQVASPSDQIREALVANGCPVPDGRGPGYAGAGGYRTLCVRSCDGYYFPVSYGVSADSFQGDAQTCQAMYGGAADAKLFVMPSDGEVSDATPVSGGKRYGAEPYAFQYRQTFNAACAAPLQSRVAAVSTTATASLAGAPAGNTAAATSNPPPLPALRGPRFEDPETLANLAGGLTPGPSGVATRGGRDDGIRVVGAGYFNAMLAEQHNAPLAVAPASVTR